jgi:hypothetical protein
MCIFPMILRTNEDYFAQKYLLTGVYKWETECFLQDTKYTFEYLHECQASEFDDCKRRSEDPW